MRLCEDHYTRLIRGISEAKVAWSVSWTLVQIGVCISGDEEGKGGWTQPASWFCVNQKPKVLCDLIQI